MSRKIEQYPDKAIRPILLSIVESLENDGVYLEDISEDYENEFQQSYPIIKSELESYGLENEFEDITYIMYIFVNNPNFTTEPIKRPELKKYEVLHIVDRTINVQDTYLNNFNSKPPSVTARLPNSAKVLIPAVAPLTTLPNAGNNNETASITISKISH